MVATKKKVKKVVLVGPGLDQQCSPVHLSRLLTLDLGGGKLALALVSTQPTASSKLISPQPKYLTFLQRPSLPTPTKFTPGTIILLGLIVHGETSPPIFLLKP